MMRVPIRERFACAPAVLALLPLAAVLVDAGCSKTTTYTYVNVHVMVDPQTISRGELATVVSCEFQVLGADMTDGFTLRCPENNVRYDVGTFMWTSNATTGRLQFRVRVFAVNRVIVGEGTSEAVVVSPGNHLTTEVLVVKAQGPTEPDGGIDADLPAEAGVETGGLDTGGGDAPQDGAGVTDTPLAETGTDAGATDQRIDVNSDGATPDTADTGIDLLPAADAGDAASSSSDAGDALPSDAPIDVAGPG